MALNASEQKVEFFCKNSFLSLWCFPNPIRKDNNKELCDLLVVCGENVLVVSVKDIKISESGDYETDLIRWEKRALDESFEQIYGAERALKNNISFVYAEQEYKIDNISNKNIYRLAIAIGRGEKFHLKFGDMGKGFIHVLDEKSLDIVMQELDTISDFIEYLREKEKFFKKETSIYCTGEEDMLAFYLHNGRKFPEQYDGIIIEENIWQEFINKPEYIKRKDAEKISYVWDDLIERFSSEFKQNTLCSYSPFGKSNVEKVLRVMAKETRFARRILSEDLTEFVFKFREIKAESRITISPSGIVYVFYQMNCDENDFETRQHRQRILALRCFVARAMNPENPIVIGLASEFRDKKKKYSYDLLYFELPELNDEHIKRARQIQDEFNFFKTPKITKKEIDEYPK